MGEAGDAVDDEQDIVALVAVVLGDRDGGKRRHFPEHRAFVTGGDDGDRFGEVVAERILDEFAHLAPALADQRDHHLVEGVGTRQHGKQRRLTDAGAGEDAETLPEQSGEKMSIARTPVLKPRSTRLRVMDGGAVFEIERRMSPWRSGPRPSIGSAKALIVRPHHLSVGAIRKAPLRMTTS